MRMQQPERMQSSSAWSDPLAVGFSALDDDHQELMDIFAQLSAAPRHARGALTDRLTAHVCAHFDREEELMRRTGFPGIARHRECHCFLLDQFNRYLGLAASHPDEVSDERLLSFIASWLKDHISSDDQAFINFLAARQANL